MILELPGQRSVICREGTLDEVVWRESWYDDCYRMTGLPTLHHPALDLGANVGAWTCLAASAGVDVYAVECWRPNIGQLIENLERLEVSRKVTILEAAVVGNHPACDERALRIGDYGAGVQTCGRPDGVRPSVRALHIDDVLLLEERWSIMKIDIEGDEYEVIESATPGLLNRVDYIVGEFHGCGMGAEFGWISERDHFGDMLTKLADWGSLMTLGSSSGGGNFFGHRYGVEAPVLPAVHVPIAEWLSN